MPRVAVLFDNFGPYHLARLTAAAGELDLLAIEIAQRSDEYAWDAALGRRGFHSECLFEGTSSKLETAGIAARLETVLGRLEPDVVAVPGWVTRASLGSVAWCLRRRVPLLVMSESQEKDEPRSWGREMVKRQVAGCFSAALVGGTTHADYLAQLGMPRERVFLGYDAVDNEYFAAGAAESRKQKVESRNRYGLPESYFLASARFVEKKNLPRLIEAYALYREKAEKLKTETLKGDRGKAESRKQKAEIATAKAETLKTEMLKGDRGKAESGKQKPEIWDLVLLGDGALRPAINDQLTSLNLHKHVHLPGFKQYPDLPAYYGLASAFVHASTTEQWGLVVNEAMASGLPVLVSNRCGCAPDLVQEGVNGFTFDPYNVEELAQLMLKISAFYFPLSTFGDASKRIIANWGPDRFASGLKAAVDCALRVGPVKPTVLQRLILKALLAR